MAKAKKKTPAKKAPAKKKAAPKKVVAKSPAKKKAVKKSTSKKKAAPVKKKPVAKAKSVSKTKNKPTAKKKAPAKATTKAAAKKKTVKKAVPKKKTAPTKKSPAKKSVATKSARITGKSTPKKALGTAPASSKRATISMAKSTKKVSLRKGALSRKSTSKPIAFSLDEVRSIAKTASKEAPTTKKAATKATKSTPPKKVVTELPPAKPSHVAAASLADILGFAPGKTKRSNSAPAGKKVPEKFKRFHKLLIDLRTHLTEGIELHSEETLKRSAKDDAGDLSSYGQHMADAGTDTFDRDFALSLVSSEQEALSEIEAAINRIYDGTYGVCEITGKAISKERLGAVPFTRYSAEAQKDLERNRHRKRTQAGLFGEHGDDVGKIMDADGDGD